MAWIKRTDPVEPVTEEDATVAEAAPAEEDIETVPDTDTPKSLRRYSKNGRRRGARRGMAVLGLAVLIFAVIGLVATVVTGIRIIQRARDTSYLKEDMYYTLLPLMQYAPAAFEDVNDSRQDALMQAALYQITNREWIRQQQDAAYTSPYTVDDFGRTAIPEEDVTAAYISLFGEEAKPYFHTFGGDAGAYFTYEYDKEAGVYYVPYSSSTSAYETVVDTIQRAGNTYKVRVGFVHLRDITIDDHGNQLVDLQKATYFQVYTVERMEDDHFVIRSVADEGETAAAE